MGGIDVDADSGLSVTASEAGDRFSPEVVGGAEVTEGEDVIQNHLRLLGDGPAVGAAFVISASSAAGDGIAWVPSAATFGASCAAVGDSNGTGSAGAGDGGIRTVVGDRLSPAPTRPSC